MQKFKGVFTALITPFRLGAVDFESLQRLVEQQVENGVSGFVINGTTAESPNLTDSERSEIFHQVRKWTGGHLPLIMGTGSNSTEKTVKATQTAEKLGADAVLVVVPYYNKPPQRGLYEHFKKTAEATSLPVFLYNVPGRSVTALNLGTIVELAKIKNIVGIKEASGNVEFGRDIVKACGPEFLLLAGDDGTYAEILAVGGHGVISVASHLLPREFADWTVAAQAGDFEAGRSGIKKYSKLIDALFIEANPIPVKKALQKMKLISSAELRLPLCEMDPEKAEILIQEMKACELLT